MADTSALKGPKGKNPIKDNRAKQKGHSPNVFASAKLPADESGSYAQLRIALDSFQAMALVYYAAGKSPKERENRAATIKRVVKKAVKQWKQPATKRLALKELATKQLATKQAAPMVEAALISIYGNGCDPGYCDCNGFCIPQGQPCY